MLYTEKRNLFLLLSHFVVKISTTNIGKCVSMLFINVKATPINIS